MKQFQLVGLIACVALFVGCENYQAGQGNQEQKRLAALQQQRSQQGTDESEQNLQNAQAGLARCSSMRCRMVCSTETPLPAASLSGITGRRKLRPVGHSHQSVGVIAVRVRRASAPSPASLVSRGSGACVVCPCDAAGVPANRVWGRGGWAAASAFGRDRRGFGRSAADFGG